MKINYDKSVDALYIEFKGSKSAKTLEKDDNVLVDFDKHGKVVGIEILHYSKVAPAKERLEISSGLKKIPLSA